MVLDVLLNLVIKVLSVCLVVGAVVYGVGLWQHPDTMRVPPLLFAGGLAMTVALTLILGRLEQGCDSFNGTGTMLYGRRDAGHGVVVSTKWVVFTWIPIIPVRSMELIPGEEDAWRPLPGVGLDWGQVVPLVLAVWGGAGVVFAALLW